MVTHRKDIVVTWSVAVTTRTADRKVEQGSNAQPRVFHVCHGSGSIGRCSLVRALPCRGTPTGALTVLGIVLNSLKTYFGYAGTQKDYSNALIIYPCTGYFVPGTIVAVRQNGVLAVRIPGSAIWTAVVMLFYRHRKGRPCYAYSSARNKWVKDHNVCKAEEVAEHKGCLMFCC